MKINNKEFIEHSSGLFVSRDGEIYFPSSGKGLFPNGHLTYGFKGKKGYLGVNRKGKIYMVHRLVAETFLDNPNNLPQVNHKDENKTNNSVENLEWCDAKYNVNYGARTARQVANTNYKAIAEKLSKKVLQLTLDGELVKEWQSTRECDKYGFDHRHIGKCCNGYLKTHKGFKWKYA